MNTIPNLIVAVSQRIDYLSDRDEYRDALDQNVNQWLCEVGCLPVPVPNNLVNEATGDSSLLKAWLKQVNPCAIVLSGGNDIGEYKRRDITEAVLLSTAEKLSLPLLGFCRGMQMMAVWAGSELVRVQNHVGVRHTLFFSDGTEQVERNVNSYHNWGLNVCPDSFEIIAILKSDNTIEAIKHLNLPWEGWMWHPERDIPFNEMDTKRFINLINAG